MVSTFLLQFHLVGVAEVTTVNNAGTSITYILEDDTKARIYVANPEEINLKSVGDIENLVFEGLEKNVYRGSASTSSIVAIGGQVEFVPKVEGPVTITGVPGSENRAGNRLKRL